MIPTPEQLIDEIERGPLAPSLKKFWDWVFEAPKEARPAEKEKQGAWDAKMRRVGLIHPDAAFEIHKILTTRVDGQPSRAEVLDWSFSGQYPWKPIKHAKIAAMKAKRAVS